MSDRDRLVELLKKGQAEYSERSLSEIKKTLYEKHTYNSATDNKVGNLWDFLADFLLSNGVIVPPCKVGDTVYFIDTCITAEDFGKEFVTFETVKRVSLDNEFVIMKSGRIKLWEDVFLTREEAERALENGKRV